MNLWVSEDHSKLSEGLITVSIGKAPGDNISVFDVEKSLMDYPLDPAIQSSLHTLFLNGIWFPNQMVVNERSIQDFIHQSFPSQQPIEKQFRLLLFLQEMSKFDGESIQYAPDEMRDWWRRLFYRSEEELSFYLSVLDSSGLIKYTGYGSGIIEVSLTAEGLGKVIKKQEESSTSNCFVAMSFAPDLVSVYDNAISRAIKAAGFTPVLIRDDRSIPSDVTINDAILAAIKNARFTVADFTNHRSGVYFEAGYALGRGQKVIYTCRKDQIDQAHFDTRNYPHTVWENEADLYRKLLDKIEIYIK